MAQKVMSSFSFLLLAGFFLTLFLAGTNFYLEMQGNSLLVLNQYGDVYRKVTNPYQYYSNMRGLVLSITFLVSSVALMVVFFNPVVNKKPKNFVKKQDRINYLSEVDALTPDVKDLPEILETQENGNNYDNVIYGSGPISNESMIEFITHFPDSALKYLFKRNFDNTALSPAIRDMHDNWESRSLYRDVVSKFIISELGLDSLKVADMYDVSKALKAKYGVIEK